MNGKDNYDGIIHMDRYEFRDQVADEVKAIEIKKALLDAKQGKLEKILDQHKSLWNKDNVDYVYNKSKDEYFIKENK